MVTMLTLTMAKIPRRLSRSCGARSLLLAELPARGLKIQAEVVTEEESTPVAADQVEEPSNWVACRGI
ncbi:uncharacterized protein LOC100275436 [Zea mays]|uniref:uncharacterized protein LOC100275436 n=1 Tax=Zea mays TaxID=4577 RepID=UPI000221DECE|nr:uncharacterized protein LOC100275436 [Zea mays]